MKYKIINSLLILMIITIFSIGCSNKQEPSIDPSKEVVIKNFQYRNEKDMHNFILTHTEDLRDSFNSQGGVYKWDTLDYVKLISIEEDKDDNYKKLYLTNGRGSINGTTEENLKVFKVEYEVKYNSPGPQDSGTYTWWYFVIREDKDSPWLIDASGV